MSNPPYIDYKAEKIPEAYLSRASKLIELTSDNEVDYSTENEGEEVDYRTPKPTTVVNNVVVEKEPLWVKQLSQETQELIKTKPREIDEFIRAFYTLDGSSESSYKLKVGIVTLKLTNVCVKKQGLATIVILPQNSDINIEIDSGTEVTLLGEDETAENLVFVATISLGKKFPFQMAFFVTQ